MKVAILDAMNSMGEKMIAAVLLATAAKTRAMAREKRSTAIVRAVEITSEKMLTK